MCSLPLGGETLKDGLAWVGVMVSQIRGRSKGRLV